MKRSAKTVTPPAPTQLSDALCQYQADGRTLLWYHERQIEFDQVRIHVSKVSTDTQELYIVVLSNRCKAATAQPTDIVRVRCMSRVEWLSLRSPGPAEKQWRICALEKNTLHVSGTQNQLSLSSNTLTRSAELCVKLPVLEPLEELWPGEFLAPNCPIDLQPVLNVVCDYTLLLRELYNRPPRLMEKWHRWLLRQFLTETHYHNALYRSLTVLCNVKLCGRVRYGCLDVPLLKEWLDLACYVFEQRLPVLDVTEFGHHLQRHIDWIEQRQHTGFYHPWSHYRVALCLDTLWICSDQRYIVSSLWLLQCDIKRENYTTQGRGRISLDCTGFNTLAVKMYRLVLSDLAHLMCSVMSVRCDLEGVDESLYRELFSVYSNSCEDVKPLQRSLHRQGCGDLYAFQLSTQYYTSPVMKALRRQHEQQDELAERRGANDPRTIASGVADIEDLATLAPPCMRAVLAKDWCKNWDRLNLVAWLYDAGYERDTVIRYMCRNVASTGSDEAQALIDSLYDDCVSPNDKRWRSHTGGLSVPCGTIINSLYEAGNVLRCPFEAAQNGERRRKKHTDAEKQLFQAQCASAGCLRRTTVTHPLDYVLEKLNKDKVL